MTVYSLILYSENTARWKSQFDLGDSRFTLYFSWNSQCEYWEFSLMNDNDNLIVGGLRLVTLIDLFEQYRNLLKKLPSGKLSLVPRNDVVTKLTRDNLNSDFALMYSEED